MKKNNIIHTAVLFLVPALVSAQALGGLRGFLNAIGGFVNQIITLLFGLAMVYFFWGMGQFILHAGDAKKLEEGKNKMIWGVIALFVMLSIYGIIYFIGDIFGTNNRVIDIKSGIIN